jgi:hypothetical protein
MPQPYIDFAFIKENASFERVLEHYDLAMRGTGGTAGKLLRTSTATARVRGT